MLKIYSLRGKPILDIEQWANDHNEKMVDIVWRIKNVNPYVEKNAISYYEEKETMPESFFNTLLFPLYHSLKSYKLREPKLPQDTATDVSID